MTLPIIQEKNIEFGHEWNNDILKSKIITWKIGDLY